MSHVRILCLGKNGQVGRELQRSLAPLGELICLDRYSTPTGNLEDLDGLVRTVLEVQPKVIVNAAAYTAVDKAEAEPELARRVNVEAPGLLATLAKQLDGWLVHYSTDYVFDGRGSRPWREQDPIGPLNTYGWSKLQGEQAIAAIGCRYLNFRTSWVYAAKGNNFLKTMLRLARERDTLNVVADQWGAPTGAELIADITAQALGQILQGKQIAAGTYHLAAAGETNWYGYACHVIERARRRKPESMKAKNVQPVSTEAYPSPAHRPENSRLDTHKLQQTFGLYLPPWQQGVDRVTDQVMEQNV